MKQLTTYCEHDHPVRVAVEPVAAEPSTGTPEHLHWELVATTCPQGCVPTYDQVVDAVEADLPEPEDLL